MKIILTIGLLLIAACCFSQKVYFVDYPQQADLKVYIVKYKHQANRIITMVRYPQQADINKNRWYRTNNISEASLKLYEVRYPQQAQIKIYIRYE